MPELDNSRVKKEVEKVAVGSKLTVKCGSDLPVLWFRQGYGTARLPVSGYTLHFERVELKHWGTYICYGKTYKPSFGETYFLSTITLKIHGMNKYSSVSQYYQYLYHILRMHGNS